MKRCYRQELPQEISLYSGLLCLKQDLCHLCRSDTMKFLKMHHGRHVWEGRGEFIFSQEGQNYGSCLTMDIKNTGCKKRLLIQSRDLTVILFI